jgi:3-deoxy-D-manno-octulosonate 8-phosphate phosphatase (KDO 8-P phosphatase)
MGDDLPDLSVMRQVGLSIAPADASETIKENADMTTRANGGNGAVREICERILKSRGVWERILKQF